MPRVLVIHEDPADYSWPEDEFIRACVSRAGDRFGVKTECGVRRVAMNILAELCQTACELIVVNCRFPQSDVHHRMARRLPADVPLVLVVDEQDQSAAAETFSRQDIDVVVRNSSLGERLEESLVEMSLRHFIHRIRQGLLRSRQVQAAMLPAAPPDVQGLDIAVKSVPAAVVGGDFFEFSRIGDFTVVLIGDVTGHGLNAALRMAEVQAYFRALLEYPVTRIEKPADVLDHVNALMVRSATEIPLLATAIIVCIETDTRLISWAGAGHEAHVLRATGVMEALGGTGPALGCLEGTRYSNAGPLTLNSGDAVLLATDGIAETYGEHRRMFGLEKMFDIVRQDQTDSAAETVENLFTQSCDFRGTTPQQDDMTAILVRVGADDV